MKKTTPLSASALAAALLASSLSFAESDHHHHDHGHDHHEDEHEVHSEEKHVHGEGELMIAKEGEEVAITFVSPAINILGFEHRVETDQEKQALEAAIATLSAHEKLFSLEGDCELEHLEVDADSLTDPHHGSDHHEFKAEYHFHCHSDEVELSINLMQQFDSLEELHVQWVTEDEQGSKEITSGALELHLH